MARPPSAVARVPFVHGALSDLKLPYVEIINPLLSESVVDLVRQLPDLLRTDKALLKRITKSLSPPIPFATTVAIQPGGEILKSRRVVDLIQDGLRSRDAGSVIPAELAAFVTNGLVHNSAKPPLAARRVRRAVKSMVPHWVKQMRNRVSKSADSRHKQPGFSRLPCIADTSASDGRRDMLPRP